MKHFLQTLLGQSLRDIVLAGVVDLDCAPADFIPFLESVYVEVGEQLVELSRDERTLHLKVAVVDAMRLDWELEDTQRFCRSSIGKYVLTDPLADNRIAQISLYAGKDEAVMAIELALVSRQIVFFDPTFVDGFNFGGIEQKTTWLNNSENYHVIVLGSLDT